MSGSTARLRPGLAVGIKRAAALPGALLFALTAGAGEMNATLTVAPEWRGLNTASPYSVTSPPGGLARQVMRSDLELRYANDGLNTLFTLRNLARDGQGAETRGILNQLYVDGEFAPGSGYTVGKKVLSWGVGQGFRPLDLIQREDRRQINPPPLEGTPLLAWQGYDANTSVTLAWSNPGSGAADNDRDDPGLAAYGYALADGADYHAVARVSQRRHIEAGAGWARTIGEAWGFHAAALYQRRAITTLNILAESAAYPFAAADPLRENAHHDVFKGVVGVSWTGQSGVGVLLEAWYDGEAYTREQWRSLDRLAASQRAQAGNIPQAWLDGNLAWSSRAFERPVLLRENRLLRLSYDAENWKTYGEVLTTPRDGGRVVSIGVSRQGDRQRLAFGLRHLGGNADSAYARSPQGRMAFMEWRYALR